MTQDDALHELRTKLVVNIITAGRAMGVKRSRAYQLADNGTIPTIRLGPGRRVVPSAKVLNMLGIQSEPEENAA